jgi:periplasmic protein TonB
MAHLRKRGIENLLKLGRRSAHTVGAPKSLAFGLSALLHLGFLCLLSLIFIKPAVTNRIMEIDLTPWSPPVRSSKGKFPRQTAAKKVSPDTVIVKPPLIHKPKPAPKEIPKPEHRAVKTVSPHRFAENFPVADDAPEEKASAHPETTPAPAVAGTGSGHLPSRSYFAAVLARIEAVKQYPPSAVRRHIEGNTVVTFRLAPDGQLLFNHLQKSSGYRMLDQAALAAVQDAAPFPGFADTTDTLPQSLSVTISFVLTP